MGRGRLWPEMGTAEFAIAGLTLLCPREKCGGRGTGFQREVREGEMKGPG